MTSAISQISKTINEFRINRENAKNMMDYLITIDSLASEVKEIDNTTKETTIKDSAEFKAFNSVNIICKGFSATRGVKVNDLGKVHSVEKMAEIEGTAIDKGSGSTIRKVGIAIEDYNKFFNLAYFQEQSYWRSGNYTSDEIYEN